MTRPPHDCGASVGLLVRSYERPDYFRRCLDSLAEADLSAFAKLRVYDDASRNPATLALLSRARKMGFEIVRSDERRGQRSMCTALERFPEVDWLCSIDNDMIVKPHFGSELLATYRRIQSTEALPVERLLLSGFNCTVGPNGGHPTISDTGWDDGFVEKASCGGACLFFHRDLREDIITWWKDDYDWGVMHGLMRRGGRVFATSPSVVQHIGEHGGNSDGDYDRAEDFSTPRIRTPVMPKLAAIIPFRRSPDRRGDVLQSCVRAWLEQPGVRRIFVVDASADRVQLDPSPKVEIIHVPYSGPFNLAFMRNVGVRRAIDAGFDYAQLLDADLFPQQRDYIARCFQLLGEAHMVMPRFRDSSITAPGCAKLGDPDYLDFVYDSLDPDGRDFHSYSTLFLRLDVPARIHGWDEAYEGWGGEDDDFLHRAHCAGFESCKLDAPLLVHSFHPRELETYAKEESDQYTRNVARLRSGQRGELPLRRMPADWGRPSTPRTDLECAAEEDVASPTASSENR